MPPESTATPGAPQASQPQPPAPPSVVQPSTPSSGPETPPQPSNPSQPLAPQPPIAPLSQKSKRPLMLIMLAVGLLAAVLLIIGAYWFGSHRQASKNRTEETTEETISVPKDATVTADCTQYRGKQYIVPKDIPMGPIYDVYQNKVVAVEYLIGQSELNNSIDTFKNLPLPHIDVDHLSILPMDPHAGENEQHFHLIAYFVPQSTADQIMCSGNGSSMDNMTMTGSQ